MSTRVGVEVNCMHVQQPHTMHRLPPLPPQSHIRSYSAGARPRGGRKRRTVRGDSFTYMLFYLHVCVHPVCMYPSAHSPCPHTLHIHCHQHPHTPAVFYPQEGPPIVDPSINPWPVYSTLRKCVTYIYMYMYTHKRMYNGCVPTPLNT